jgi:2-phospho-L-lactate guanylyltransferase
MNRELAVIVPAKDPAQAKSRLSPLLPAAARHALASALFRQTLAFFRQGSPALPLAVVTDCAAFAEEAAAAGAAVIRDAGTGLTAAVEEATRWSLGQGFRAQLVIPSDIAVLDRAELAHLLAVPRPAPSVTLCPSAEEDGTNALLTTPPDALPIWYAPGSFARYLRAAQAAAIPVTVLRLPGLGLDLDTPADIRRFLERAPRGAILELLSPWLPAHSS